MMFVMAGLSNAQALASKHGEQEGFDRQYACFSALVPVLGFK